MFFKENVELHEYRIHKYIHNLDIVNIPRPISYDKEKKQFTMQKIQNMCVADFYGEDAKNVPIELFEKIRLTIATLFEHNIMYPDITGYNFIEFGPRVYIVDFGHAYFRHRFEDKMKEEFILKFIEGANQWNPDFA